MLNFGFLEKGLRILSLPHFVYNFSRKMFLLLYAINWPNFISWLLLILQTSDKTSADEQETSTDEWRRMRDEWKRMRDKCKWMKDECMQTNERRLQTSEDERRQMRDQCRRVKTNERQGHTNEAQMRTLVHLQDDSRCLRAFTFLNMLTDLMFKTSILFPYFGHFGPY